jgi:ribonuclease J
MTRPSLIRDYVRAGVMPTAEDAWSWSQWRGYLKTPEGEFARRWLEDAGARAEHIHSSGHASPPDLRAFAQAMSPKRLVPIHGLAWDGVEGFANVERLADGQPLIL